MFDTSSARLPEYFGTGEGPAAAAAAQKAAGKQEVEESGTVRVKAERRGPKSLKEMDLMELSVLAAKLVAEEALEKMKKGEDVGTVFRRRAPTKK